MSLWYDKNKRSYASNGHGSWIKLYAEHLFDVLKEEIFSKFAGHYSGNEGKHSAEDILCDDSSVKEKIDKLCVDTDRKVDKESGMGLSQNSFSNAEKSKLAGIQAGAEANLVKSVAGKTGDVTISKSDLGLDNVDNTADINKPISRSVQNALRFKEDKAITIDLTQYNVTVNDILNGNYFDNLSEGNYIIKYGSVKTVDQIDYPEYNYAPLKIYKNYSNIDDVRYVQEISFSAVSKDTNESNPGYTKQKYTRVFCNYDDELSWSEWKKDISYQEIICDEDLLTTNMFDDCFSAHGQLERYVVVHPDNQVKGELTVIFAGNSLAHPDDPDACFYTQILEVFGDFDFYKSTRNISRYVRTYGKYEDTDGTPTIIKAWSEWIPVDGDMKSVSADTKNIALVNNREYYLTGTTDLTLTFPADNFESWLSISFADAGSVSLNFPENARYIGYAPFPSNGETWEISVKNGVVVGAKVGGGNE